MAEPAQADLAREQSRPPEPDLPGPFAVGRYAERLRQELRRRARVRLVGEVAGVRRSRAQAYFELRDSEGAVPCAIWIADLERLGLADEALREGAQLVVSGGPDYYPGGPHASPSFCFRATHLRPAGEGDLLARLAALRTALRAEGLFEPQKQLPRPLLPKTIGVITAESGAARQDLRVALERRGWRGTVIWGFAPVQDRHAAPAITRAMQDLAALPEVELIVVCRGGGSLADLWAFCDETLCRTVALLRVPVISAVGHERDSTLIDDVAALACSTPTHAAEAAVPLDCARARRELRRRARSIAGALQRQRRELNQITRELRAASGRGVEERARYQRRIAGVVLARTGRRGLDALAAARRSNARTAAAIDRAGARSLRRRGEAIERIRVALRGHDPDRVLERGFALVETSTGEPLTRAAEAAVADSFAIRFKDGRIEARPARGGRGSERAR